MKKSFFVYIGIAIALVILSSFFLFPSKKDVFAGRGHAVFLSNGQVYFGVLEPYSDEFVMLRNVHYLQKGTSEELDSDARVGIISLGSEAHMPKDTMYISKQQILFWEELQETSPMYRVVTR